MEYFIEFAILFFSAIIQGTLGFGFSLIAIPLLSFFMPMSLITPILICYSFILNISVLSQEYKSVKAGEIIVLVICGSLTIPLGAAALKYLDPSVLKLAVGALITVAAINMLKGATIKFRNQHLAQAIFGSISGLMNGSLSLSGPPAALYFQNLKLEKSKFRANYSLYALLTNIFAISTMFAVGLLNTNALINIGKLSPSVIMGVILGIYAASKINENRYRKSALLLITVMGVCTFSAAALSYFH
jgi:uncharacterized membrane protein YfcA